MKVKIKRLPDQAYNGLEIEDNQYKMISPSTVQFQGPSHSKGGIDLSFLGKNVEVEGNETAHLADDGSLIIGGNMEIPGSNKKFKSAFKDLAKEENRAVKLEDKANNLIDNSNPYQPYSALAFNSGNVMNDAAMQNHNNVSQQKEALGTLQNFMLDLADSTGRKPEYISKIMKNGGTLKARGGAKVSRGYDSEDINSVVAQAAREYNIDPQLLLSQVQTESGGNPNAVSNKNAMGFAQFVEGTAKKYGITKEQLKSSRPEDIQAVADAQAHHMRDLLDANGGDEKLALIGYNGGQGAINKVRGWMGNPEATGDDIMSYWANKRASGASKAPNAYHNQTYEYVNSILGNGNKDAFREQYYNNDLPTLNPIQGNPLPVQNNFTPTPINQDTLQRMQNSIPQNPNQGVQQPNKLPSLADRNKLGIGNFLGDIAAIADRPDYVPGLHYNPTLFEPYSVSYQDRLNENNASFRQLTKQLPNNPEALSTLAAQKYSADNNVMADQFRTNQGIYNQVTNANNQIINNAALTNLQLDDTQLVRQAQAKSNTRSRRDQALADISNKFAANRSENNKIRMYESLSQFRPNEDLSLQYQGNPYQFNFSGAPNGNNKTTTNIDQYGNQTTKVVDDPLLEEQRKQAALEKSRKASYLSTRKWGGII